MGTLQKTFTDHRALVLSYELREAMLGIIHPGLYCGFDGITKTSTGFRITHDRTGVIKNKEDWKLSKPVGVYVTNFGTIVHEEDPIDMVIPGETKPGNYMLVAKYQRAYVGTEVEVKIPITYELRPLTNEDEPQPGQYDTPLFSLTITGDSSNREYSFGANPGSADMTSSSVLSHDDVKEVGVRGLGKFKELGRTLKALDDWLKEKDRKDNNLIEWLGIPNYDGSEDQHPNNPETPSLPTTYHFISATYTIWYNLFIIDTQLKSLWDKLGFPKSNPEDALDIRDQEKKIYILDTLKTVWDNFINLKKYLESKDKDIWDKLGIPAEDPSGEDALNWIKVANTVWGNMAALDKELKRFEDYVAKWKLDLETYLTTKLEPTLGYFIGVLPEGEAADSTRVSVKSTKSIWKNLVDLQAELKSKNDALYQSNDFKVYKPTIKLGTSAAPVQLSNTEVFKAIVVDLSATTQDGNIGYVSMPSDNSYQGNQIVFVTNGSSDGDNNISKIVTGIRDGEVTKTYRLYPGGILVLSKLNGESFWRVNAHYPGREPSPIVGRGTMNGYDVQDGKERFDTWANNMYVPVGIETGMTLIDYVPVVNQMFSFTGLDAGPSLNSSGQIYYPGVSGDRYIYGKYMPVLTIPAPTESMEGLEKVIKIAGDLDSMLGANKISGGWGNERLKFLYFNLALGQSIVDIEYHLISKSNCPRRPYLKYPGDWIRLKAMRIEGNMKWVIIDYGYGGGDFVIFNSTIPHDIPMSSTYFFILAEPYSSNLGKQDNLKYIYWNSYYTQEDSKQPTSQRMFIDTVGCNLHLSLSLVTHKDPSASGTYWLNPAIPPVLGDNELCFTDQAGTKAFTMKLTRNAGTGGRATNAQVWDVANGNFHCDSVIPLDMAIASTIYEVP